MCIVSEVAADKLAEAWEELLGALSTALSKGSQEAGAASAYAFSTVLTYCNTLNAQLVSGS